MRELRWSALYGAVIDWGRCPECGATGRLIEGVCRPCGRSFAQLVSLAAAVLRCRCTDRVEITYDPAPQVATVTIQGPRS